MNMSIRIRSAVVAATLVAVALAGCASPVNTQPTPTSSDRNASETLRGTRLCFASSGVGGLQVRGSSWLNDLLAWKGWDDVTSEQEYCVEGFASSSVNIDQGSGLRNMWTDIRADVRFADGVLLNFFGDNPLIGAPMVGWSTGGDEAGWGSETLNSRNSKSVTYGGRTFTVERRADSDYNKEFLITFTR